MQTARTHFSAIWFRALASVVLLLWATSVRAEPPTYPLLVGKEVEVPAEHLVHLLPYFDLEPVVARLIQESGWSPRLAEAKKIPPRYLTHPAEFNDLPEKTRNRWNTLLAEGVILLNRPSLREDCPAHVKQILETMSWDRDSAALEFRDEVPYSDEAKFNEHTTRFLKLVHMEDIENNPMKHLGKTRMHFHLSVENGRDLTPIFELVNILSLMRFIEGGQGRLALTDQYGFSLYPKAKGLTKQIDENHFELRNHFFSPAEDVRYLRRLFSQSEAESKAELGGEIAKRLTPEAISLLGQQKLEVLVHILLRLKLSFDSPQIRELLHGALSNHRNETVKQFLQILERIDLTFGSQPEAVALGRKILTAIQNHFTENPEAFYHENRSRIPELRQNVDKFLPPSERKLSFAGKQWPEIVLGPIRDPGFSEFGYQRIVRVLLEDNAEAVERVKELLSNPLTAERMLFHLHAEGIFHPELNAVALGAISRLSETSYARFLQWYSYDLQIAAPSERDLKPILARALGSRQPELKEIAETRLGEFQIRQLQRPSAIKGCGKDLSGLADQ